MPDEYNHAPGSRSGQARLLQRFDDYNRALPEPTTFCKRSSVTSVQNDFFLLIFSGCCPETHFLFAKRKAKTLIRSL
jgi:hypothetical protein